MGSLRSEDFHDGSVVVDDDCLSRSAPASEAMKEKGISAD
jgi:hypothetical protein